MSVRFCDACQGGGAYGKPAAPRPFFVAVCLYVSSPSARRSRTTERSESVSEEAEYLRAHVRHLTLHNCIFS
ncbi:TPA: hypothetical protein ACF2XD_004565 [Escherichia coli]|nr:MULTISPECIES: hypothetical protein [Enterobacteriaceae]MDD8259580.1 hypothetical protein [Escherichia coli]MDF3655718.1 hypothetical protein [Enterobacter hormaechei]